MNTNTKDIQNPSGNPDTIDGVVRVETTVPSEMEAMCMEMTHAVYPHDKVYGNYCTIEEYIDCPPDEVYEYLSKVESLAEWTWSTRDFEPAGEEGLYVGYDRPAQDTEIYCRVESNPIARTVDYHCAWDQGKKLWMIYLMRVVPAELVLNKKGSVVLWSNCHHPYYDENPFPETEPKDREVWVGDLWTFFYAGHYIEMQNLKHILEHRHANGLPIGPYTSVSKK